MARLLWVGAGDIAQYGVKQKLPFEKIYVLLRARKNESALQLQQRKHFWVQNGALPILGDLDDIASLKPFQALADVVVHSVPPHPAQNFEVRTRNLLATLSFKPPKKLIYLSSTQVYGNETEKITENTPPQPLSHLAQLHLNAEKECRAFSRRWGTKLCILRVPFIYNRERLPVQRVKEKSPVLVKTEDVYLNLIHTQDLCQALFNALRFGKNGRIYNIVDDSDIKMGDYFDLIADYFNLPRVPRLPFNQMENHLTPKEISFLKESRRITFGRWVKELNIKMHYPTVQDFFKINFPR